MAVGPSLTHASKFELRNKTFETPGALARAGAHVSIITDSPVIPQQYLPLCAGLAIRSGMDMFKALALGADAVLIGRPFVTTVYGGGEEGVQLYVQKLKAELADTMRMCGAHSLADIDRSMLYGF